MTLETASLSSSESVRPGRGQFEIPTQRVQARIRRCVALLDLSDSHIILSLQGFSTPLDQPLEQLRTELEGLLRLTTWPPQGAVATATVSDRVQACRASLDAAVGRLAELACAADAVGCALYYLRAELAALATDGA